jgi:predicted Zn-ribbon and HTH transcriptional regulator
VVTPATCRDCHFVFHKRTRLTRPGKCPLCRSTRLSEPMFSLTSTDHAP